MYMKINVKQNSKSSKLLHIHKQKQNSCTYSKTIRGTCSGGSNFLKPGREKHKIMETLTHKHTYLNYLILLWILVCFGCPLGANIFLKIWRIEKYEVVPFAFQIKLTKVLRITKESDSHLPIACIPILGSWFYRRWFNW